MSTRKIHIYILLIFVSFQTHAQQEYAKYQFSIKFADVQKALRGASEPKGDKSKKTYLELPTPTGEMLKLNFEEEAVMAPELAKRFSSIKTYTAFSASSNARVGKLVLTGNDIRGYFSHHTGYFHIQAVDAARGMYESAYEIIEKGDGCSESGHEEGEDIPHNETKKLRSSNAVQAEVLRYGEKLTTYRMAIITTAEFYTRNGGTEEKAMAELLNTMAALNQKFETELAIKFVLVASYFHKNAATDGLNEDSSSVNRVDQALAAFNSRAKADSVNFGTNKYDIGHVLYYSPGGGGLASFYSVCTTRKSKGWSGVGPRRYTTFVHEVGHQFGAGHTFNSVSEFCDGNYDALSAVEPGSGSTFMSYWGSCAPDNISGGDLLDNTYFHAQTLETIRAFNATRTKTCGTITSTSNNPPTISADGGNTGFIVPKGTPFELIGRGSDADKDSLLFNWEQMDIGTTRGGADDAAFSTDSPIFRSVEPSRTGSGRVFPNLNTILTANKAANNDEALPQVARKIRMLLTARDQRGGVASDDLEITVSDTGPLEVVSFGEPTTIRTNESVTLSWNVNRTDSLASEVVIWLAVDGKSFSYLGLKVPNTGNAEFVLPPTIPLTTQGRFRVEGYVASEPCKWFDINRANITIEAGGKSYRTCSFAAGNVKQSYAVTADDDNFAYNGGYDKGFTNSYVVANQYFTDWVGSTSGSQVSSAVLVFKKDVQTVLEASETIRLVSEKDRKDTSGNAWSASPDAYVRLDPGGPTGRIELRICPKTDSSTNARIAQTALDVAEPASASIKVYPNPAREEFTVRYSLNAASKVQLSIHNLQGQELHRLIDGVEQSAGEHQQHFKLERLIQGAYFIKLQTSDPASNASTKLIVE